MSDFAEDGKYAFECLCKGVAYEVTGAPAMTATCHCESCRSYGGGPASVAVFPPDKISYSKGEDNLIKWEAAAMPGKFRLTCKTCGGWVQNVLPPNNMQIIPLGNLKAVSGPILRPSMHIWVGDRGDLPAPEDDLPKHEGWPS
mmetsp:Transcript_17308/g.28948  ORF Transcript_17308/g.28948 Transcript_17308/m.28948 type:complete len:143 (+) Transcript_17308:54-482(+)